MNEKKKRLPLRGKFADQAAVAEQLKAKGSADFESVYGAKNPGAFSMSEDINAMNGVIHMPEETKDLTAAPTGAATTPTAAVAAPAKSKAAAGFSMPDPKAELPMDMPVANMGPDNDPLPETEETEEEEVELTPEQKCQKLYEFVVDVTGVCPPVETLIQWKKMHGDLFMLHMGERVFLFRYLKRQEKIQMEANPQYEQLPEHKREEDIYHRCVLWPQSDPIKESSDPAGMMGMLSKQIKMQSMFLDEMYIAQLVLKV